MINAKRVARDFIVIGGSAGSVGPMIRLLSGLPRSIPAAIAVVVHRSPFHESRLSWVLSRRSRLSVIEPTEAEPVKHGVVYVAPRPAAKPRRGGVLHHAGSRIHEDDVDAVLPVEALAEALAVIAKGGAHGDGQGRLSAS
jgi:chemotaxis response regulator CheB